MPCAGYPVDYTVNAAVPVNMDWPQGKAYSRYFDELRRAMAMIAADPMSRFIGQSVKYDGHALYRTLEYEDGNPTVPQRQRIEMPVIEDFQMGYSIGLAMQGFTVVSIYPRFDFLLLACNQLVNHLDKLPITAGINPKVIIRTAVGSTKPLDPGPQHKQNHTAAFRSMLQNVEVIEITRREDVFPAYQRALLSNGSFLMVEHMDCYDE